MVHVNYDKFSGKCLPLLWLFSVSTLCRSECPVGQRETYSKSSFEDVPMKPADSAKMSVLSAKTKLVDCMKTCSELAHCLSTVYDQSTGTCVLYNSDVMTLTLTSGERAVMKGRADVNQCQAPDLCDPAPCPGTCDVCVADTPTDYSCVNPLTAVSQLWAPDPWTPYEGILIRNVATGLCIDVEGRKVYDKEANVVSGQCDWTDGDQHWSFAQQGFMHLQYPSAWGDYVCMEVNGVATRAKANVQLYGCFYGDDHQWDLVYDPQGTMVAGAARGCEYFQLRNRASGYCLAVEGEAVTAPGANIHTDDCQAFGTPNTDQWWTILIM